jgi:maltooligosyltrehalose synthase
MVLQQINHDAEALLNIAYEQEYRLCHWQETDHQINYRRFFTVNGLICLNIQDEHVFETYHQLIKQLVDEGIFQGLRIDHVDGLYDPSGYLHRLRKLAGEETYIVVEKILEQEEHLPEHWPIEGKYRI